MVRGDIVKDDSGAYAFFTEQSSSASQMTAAKVMDVIARLPDCDGQAADAVSPYTQVKLKDAPRLLKIQKKRNVQMYGYVFHDIHVQNLGQTLKFLLKEIYTDTHLLDHCGKVISKKFCWNLDGQKCRVGNVKVVYRYAWMMSKSLE